MRHLKKVGLLRLPGSLNASSPTAVQKFVLLMCKGFGAVSRGVGL